MMNNWIAANAAINAESLRRHRFNRRNREWMVICVPGNHDDDPAAWFAAHRVTRRSSEEFATYEEALAEVRRRNANA